MTLYQKSIRTSSHLIALLTVLGVLLLHSCTLAAQNHGGPPNVILIMTDDQGYGDLSLTGNDIVETPFMDQIATEGAWLKRFYVSPVCTPTRAHLMTGRYAYRTRAIDTFQGRACMEPEEVTLAEALSEAGYATGIFGKWHLGDYYPTRAMDQGFQESVVHQGGGLRQPSNPPEGERYHDPILFHNGQPKRYEGFCTDIFFSEAIRFIEQQATQGQETERKPFLVYLPTNAPHGPYDEPPTLELLERFRAKLPNDKTTNRASFYAMVKNIDDNIGCLLTRIKELGIERETLVIFLTDNGPSAGSAGPFRKKKGAVHEGGIRTVCFLRWPGVIKPGSTSDQMAAHIDLMPTILDMCGADLPSGVKFDGRSLRPLLAMQDSAEILSWPERHLLLQWHRGNVPDRYHHFALIGPKGRWKLLNDSASQQVTLPAPPKFELYDLHRDAGETNDLAAEHPQMVSQLKQAYDELFDDICHTRNPNFGMPPIVIGSEQQATVILTRQDIRNEAGEDRDVWASGFWPVDVRRDGPYTINVRLDAETTAKTTVELVVTIDTKQMTKDILFPRGIDSMAVGKISLPATGIGRIRARVLGDDRRKSKVYQVTITMERANDIGDHAADLHSRKKPDSGSDENHAETSRNPKPPKIAIDELNEYVSIPGKLSVDEINKNRALLAEKGVPGNEIKLKDKHLAQIQGGRYGSRPMLSDIKLHTPLNSTAHQAAGLHGWPRWYQQDRNMQIFRLLKGEAYEGERPNKIRVEAYASGSEFGFHSDDNVTAVWTGRFTIIEPRSASIFQSKSKKPSLQIGMRADDGGTIVLNPRTGDSIVLAKDMNGRSFDLMVKDDGFRFEVYFDGALAGSGSYARDRNTHFRWGMYAGERGVETYETGLLRQGLIVVSGAQITFEQGHLGD